MSLSVRAIGKREMRDAAKWYDKQSPGLGEEFLQEVDRVFRTIQVDPRRFPVAEGEIRVAKTDRFPYAIYFRTQRTKIEILADFHGSRDPAEWQGRS